MRDIVFDVETTGLDPQRGDRITELGCVEVVDLLPTGRTFQSYINPQRAQDARAAEITGLTDEFLRDQPVFADVAQDFAAFIGDGRMVAHNAAFDRGFINMELKRVGIDPVPDERWVDTLEIARTMFPGQQNSLDALCKRFGISLESRDKHGALLDSELLARVYLELSGGRERSLDLDAAQNGAAADVQRVAEHAAGRRMTPLSTDDERAAHERFVAELGGEVVWGRWGVAMGTAKAD